MNKNDKKVKNALLMVKLHLCFMLFSITTICSKMAGLQTGFNGKFVMWYGIMLLLLGVYALAWQKIIKKMPLTLAYANKGITIVWGMIWGLLFFQEEITVGNIIGSLIIISGIVLFAMSDEGSENNR